MGINDYVANMSGYLFGMVISFFLNKYYVFKSGVMSIGKVYRFILVFLVSYLLNLIILYMAIDKMSSYTSQLLAMIGYTTANFLLNKFFVFNKL